MASSSTHHTQEYQKAVAAYVQGHYDEAAKITDALVGTRPDDPNLRLLRGHIYCCQQQYNEAHTQYQEVLNHTTDPDLITLANESIAKIQDFIRPEPAPHNGGHDWDNEDSAATSLQGDHTILQGDHTMVQGAAASSPELSLDSFENFGTDLGDFSESSPFDDLDISDIESEYAMGAEASAFNPFDEDATLDSADDPFNLPPLTEPQPSLTLDEFGLEENIPEIPIGESVQPIGTDAVDDDDVTMLMGNSPFGTEAAPVSEPAPAAPTDDHEALDALFDFAAEADTPALEDPFQAFPAAVDDADATPAAEELALFPEAPPVEEETSAAAISDLLSSETEVDLLPEVAAATPDSSDEEGLFESFTNPDLSDLGDLVAEPLAPDNFDPGLFDDEEQTIAMSQFPTPDPTVVPSMDAPAAQPASPPDFGEDETIAMTSVPPFSPEMEATGDETIALSQQSSFDPNTFTNVETEAAASLEEIANFDFGSFELEDFSAEEPAPAPVDFDEEMTIANPQLHPDFGSSSSEAQTDLGTETFAVLPDEFDLSQDSLADLAEFSLDLDPAATSSASSAQDSAQELSTFAQQPAAAASRPVTPPRPVSSPTPTVTPTPPSPATAAGSFSQQNLTSAVTTGVLSALAAGAVGLGFSAPTPVPVVGGTAAGLTAGLAAYALGQRSISRVKRFCTDLQAQCNAVIAGDMTARVPVTSNDELGLLAQSFNQMTDTIQQITSDAQKKAEENERQRDDLQRQVIRLLDDVEGAARGDLTVQAEVTADVLGAVADSFNLTIHNLRTIVQQVKVAAQQVSRGAAENETFARSLSADALRQAEELAVTLNSVQMMTNAIQRVAESAQEANAVARNASETALRGGEAVERTVAGILQIRETVAETTRKVKRLAESSQEIAKIVGVISSIANRTNLLALNASIEAARAGESGRGFAVVADEVRQLADRAAKASKEIEQIVLQIQSETGAVMTAMEEGTQQVIEGTKRAEQAKHSLEDIIQVSSQIDALVRSITNSTVEQTESARAMAQVMQSIELTAQATSQEAQRVSDSLQGLVSVARNLQTSVERFRVESTEDQA
ncbi:methyl-accepting chemotaxis protein [Thermosynechococcaceae cyanobacterium Okahandja]